jgi:hypothetical protein
LGKVFKIFIVDFLARKFMLLLNKTRKIVVFIIGQIDGWMVGMAYGWMKSYFKEC